MSTSQRYVLNIDGNFFIRRAVAHLFDQGHTFQPERLQKDEKIFLGVLSQQFSNIIKNAKPYISKVIIARDSGSWRKNVQVILPKESTKSETDAEYKANRVADEAINWEGVYGTVDKFFNVLSEMGVPIIKAKSAEGDDILYVTSRILNKNGHKCMLWSSDGDIPQLVNEHTVLYKMPKRMVWLNERCVDDFFQQNKTIFTFDATSLHDEVIKSSEGHQTTNPFMVVLSAIVYGQDKDNIPPLFFWKSSGGNRTFKPSYNHMLKALAKLGYAELPNDTNFDLLYDTVWISNFISELLLVTKQTRELQHTHNIFVNNRKLTFLDKREIPEDVVKGIQQSIMQQFTKQHNLDDLSKQNVIFNKFGLTEAGSIFEALLD